MGIATVGNFDEEYRVVVGGRQWAYAAMRNDTQFSALSLQSDGRKFSARSIAIASGDRFSGSVSLVYMALWSATQYSATGIYSTDATKGASARLNFLVSSPCPDGLTLSKDRATLF